MSISRANGLILLEPKGTYTAVNVLLVVCVCVWAGQATNTYAPLTIGLT